MISTNLKKLILLLALAVLVLTAGTIASANQTRREFSMVGNVRNAPYPYKSMLAVCSDIDGSTLRIFLNVHKYLNTDGDTFLGKGLGLDIADSFWMYAENDDGAILDYDGAKNASVMSYFKEGGEELKNNEEIIRFFNAGWIDSIHSYGDFSRVDTSKPVFTRQHAVTANSEMTENGLLPTIWINHGNSANVQNIRRMYSAPGLRYQRGGNPSSEFYHADFTIASGIKYVWFSNHSGTFSVKTPLYAATLEDGQRVWGFNRYTGENGWMRHKYKWSSYDFNEQVSEENLDELVRKGDVAIVAQHLGASNGDYIFTGETKKGFERLKEYEMNYDILVARTSRLLEFVRTRDFLNYTYDENEVITVNSIDDPVLGFEAVTDASQLRGISFNVNNAETAEIFIGDSKAPEHELIRGEGVIGFKWYEKDLTDYSVY